MTSSWEIELDGDLGSTSFSQGSSYVGLSESDTHGDAELFVRRFLRPVVDDDAPRTLQPFLQRASTIFADVTAGGFTTTEAGVNGSRVDWNVGAGLGADVYVTKYFALTAALSFDFDELQDSIGASFATIDKTNSLSPGGGVGFRIGDARIDLSYVGLVQTSSGPTAGNWGTIALSGQAVLARNLLLQLTLSAFHAGAGVSGSAEYFFTKDLGVFLGGLGLVGEHYEDGTEHDDYGLNAGVGFWPVSRLRLVAEYELTGRTDAYPGLPSIDNLHELDNTAHVSALVRLP